MATTTETHWPELAAAPAIPGLRFRRLDLDADIEELVEMVTVCVTADDLDYRPSVDDTRHDYEHRANFDVARDVIVAEIDGRMVGSAERNIAVRDGIAVHQSDCVVLPEVRRRGLGRALLGWVIDRSREAAQEWPGGEPHELGTWVDDGEAGSLALLESEGYRQVRYGFMMVRPLDEPIPGVALPEGVEVRPVVEADHRRIWDADDEAFQDHWGAKQRTEEDFVRWFTGPNTDTDLFRVAWDGDEVAGSVWNVIWTEENESIGIKRGWLEHISVRRPWRKRGLATALIADSLRMFRDMGMEEGALGVDSENPSGALRLYESLGFRRHKRGVGLRRKL
jgi:mycothiol synthase